VNGAGVGVGGWVVGWGKVRSKAREGAGRMASDVRLWVRMGTAVAACIMQVLSSATATNTGTSTGTSAPAHAAGATHRLAGQALHRHKLGAHEQHVGEAQEGQDGLSAERVLAKALLHGLVLLAGLAGELLVALGGALQGGRVGWGWVGGVRCGQRGLRRGVADPG
jgi:hypothetical protein